MMLDDMVARKNSLDWVELPVKDVGEALVVAMGMAGVEYLFFTSGSEICFYQEAIAQCLLAGRHAPKLITINHEHVGLNAALGYAAVSGKPAVTAVHVDAGTLHHGGAIHTAYRAGLPVLMTAGAPPTAYPGSMPGARGAGGHIWMQQTLRSAQRHTAICEVRRAAGDL
jgi:acetolactate synthase-1/2/3 large subunit